MTDELEQAMQDAEFKTVVINPSTQLNIVAVSFFREQIATVCTADEDCMEKPKFVHNEDHNDTVCTVHRLTIPRHRKKEFVKIEDVPSQRPSTNDLLAEAFEEDEKDEPEVNEPEVVRVNDDELGGIFSQS